MKRVLVWLVGLVLAAAGVVALRAEAMTVHEQQPPGSRTEFVIDAQTRDELRHLPEMARSLVSVCRLLVNGDVVEASFTRDAPGTFSFAVTPGLGEFDVREMKGCLQDTRVQHLRADVRSVRLVLP